MNMTTDKREKIRKGIVLAVCVFGLAVSCFASAAVIKLAFFPGTASSAFNTLIVRNCVKDVKYVEVSVGQRREIYSEKCTETGGVKVDNTPVKKIQLKQ